MATATLDELVEALGGIPLHRILVRPALGCATEADVAAIHDREDRLCELVDGVLVEKTSGLRESVLTAALASAVWSFASAGQLGIVTGPDGAMRLVPGLVRIPNVAFFSWARLPDGRIPREPIPDVVPDLAVEVLSPVNTGAEMARKRGEYCRAGIVLVWEVDPDTRTVAVFDSAEHAVTLAGDDSLDGGGVLPGFVLPLAELFAVLDFRDPARPAS